MLLGPLPYTEIYNETISGLASTLKVNCPFCGKSNTVSSSKTHRYGSRGPHAFDVNSRAALATLNAGIGHTHLSTITAALDIPTMNHVTCKARESGKSYRKGCRKELCKGHTSWKEKCSTRYLRVAISLSISDCFQQGPLKINKTNRKYHIHLWHFKTWPNLSPFLWVILQSIASLYG